MIIPDWSFKMYVAEKKRDRLARCAALKTVAFNCKNSVSWCVISVGKMTCMKVVKSEGEFDYSFLRNEDFCHGNGSTCKLFFRYFLAQLL